MWQDLSPGARGAVWMALATIAWTVMIALVRMLSGEISTFETMFFRNVVAVVALTPVLMRGGARQWRTQQPGLHCIRAVMSFVGMLGFFYAIGNLPLSDLVALSFTQPLFVVVLAALVLGERVGMARWRATAIGFAGVLIIVRPGFQEIGIATIAVIASALLYAGSNICIKVLMRTDTPAQAAISVNLLMLPLSFVSALPGWTTPDPFQTALLVGVGVSGTLGIYLISQAYHAADASAVVPYDFLRLPLTAAVAFMLFGETTNLWTWIGALVIFASSYVLARTEARTDTPAPMNSKAR
jgi:drug/metabolite transporter (DMT)-like permease